MATGYSSADLFQILGIFLSLSETESQYQMFMSGLLLPVYIRVGGYVHEIEWICFPNILGNVYIR